DPAGPEAASVAGLGGQGGLVLVEPRVLRDYDARDRADAVRRQRVEPRLGVLRADARIRADLLRGRQRRGIQETAGVVLHVDAEGVDLGLVGESRSEERRVGAARGRGE